MFTILEGQSGPSEGVGLEVEEPQVPLLASAKAISFNVHLSHHLWGASHAHHTMQGDLLTYAAHPGPVSLSCAFCMLGEGLSHCRSCLETTESPQ